MRSYGITSEDIYNEQLKEFDSDNYKQMVAELKNKPTIAIVMPIYNADIKWLKVAIQSIQNQYYTNWKLYTVDDGSLDRRCCAVLQEEARKDSRIIFLSLPSNQGISAATNLGIKSCKEEFIALMDQDDEISPDALFWMANEINKFNN